MLDDTHDHHPFDPSRTGIGQPVRRKEDLRLVVGKGNYSDDVSLPGQAYAIMVRSPHAHARLRSIDTGEAAAMPGVLAVFTGRDMLNDGIKPVPHKQWSYHPAEIPLQNRDGTDPEAHAQAESPPRSLAECQAHRDEDGNQHQFAVTTQDLVGAIGRLVDDHLARLVRFWHRLN